MNENQSSRRISMLNQRMPVYLSRGFLGLVFSLTVVLRVVIPQLTEVANFPERAQIWLNTINATGYLQHLLYITEFVTGIAILSGVFVPLALIALAPVIFNIALFHFFLDSRPERILLVLLMISAHIILTYHYRAAFQTLFEPVKPTWSSSKVAGFSIRFWIQMMMGLIFLMAGAAKLIIPEQLSVGNPLIDGMKATGYMYPVLGLTEVVAGITLLSDRFIPMTLVILIPIIINIFAFHLFLAVAGLPIAILLLSTHISLIIAYFPAYRGLLKIDSKINF